MRQSDINLKVLLDVNNIPDSITWEATDKPTDTTSDCKAISLNIWDKTGKGTMRIDLWTKEMPVNEMKRFCIEIIAGLGDTLGRATNDAYMANEIDELCAKLVQHMREEENKPKA
ncbi:MAG: gliding motility protein GldC [Cytophagales bacterium]